MAIFGPPPSVIDECRLRMSEHNEARSMFVMLVEVYTDDDNLFQRIGLWMQHSDLTTAEFKTIVTREASRVNRFLQECRRAVKYHEGMLSEYQAVLNGDKQLGEIQGEKPEFTFAEVASMFKQE